MCHVVRHTATAFALSDTPQAYKKRKPPGGARLPLPPSRKCAAPTGVPNCGHARRNHLTSKERLPLFVPQRDPTHGVIFLSSALVPHYVPILLWTFQHLNRLSFRNLSDSFCTFHL